MNKLIEKIKAAGSKLEDCLTVMTKYPDALAGIIVITAIILAVASAMALQDAIKMEKEGKYFRYEKFCMDGKIVYLMENRKKDVRQFYVSNEKCTSDKNRAENNRSGF